MLTFLKKLVHIFTLSALNFFRLATIPCFGRFFGARKAAIILFSMHPEKVQKLRDLGFIRQNEAWAFKEKKIPLFWSISRKVDRLYLNYVTTAYKRTTVLRWNFDQLLQGAFNNYVDQIWPNFDPLPPSNGQLLTFYIIPTLCHVTKHGLSTGSLPFSSCPQT